MMIPSFGHGSLRRRRRKWAHSPVAPARLGGGLGPGGPFLPDIFPGGRQILEAAFGADLSADPETWTWTDITTAALWDPGGNIRIGFGGESLRATPAFGSWKLLNNQVGGGDWTIGNIYSRYWPYVRENTPIRERLDVGNGPTTRFYGYLTGVPPARAPGAESMVMLNAHGYLRRLTTGQGPITSALRKAIERTVPRAYWPLEGGAGAVVGASVVVGVDDLRVSSGTVSFGASGDDLPSSLPLVNLSTTGVAGQLAGTLPARTATFSSDGEVDWRVEFVVKAGEIGAGESISIIDWTTIGSVQRWNITAKPVADGGLVINYYTASTSGTYTSSISIGDAKWHHVRIDAEQTLTNIAITVTLDGTAVITQTLFAIGNSGDVKTVTVNPSLNTDTSVPGFGHLAIWSRLTHFVVDTYDAFLAYTGETVAERMARIAEDWETTLRVIGDADDLMGPQRPGRFLDVLQDAIDVDQGALIDGLSPGLDYYTRQSAYALPAALTLDSARGDFPRALAGQHDDQGRVNVYTARDPFTGGDRTFEETEGDLGTDTVGTYDTGGDHRVYDLAQLDQIAAFRVGVGTVRGVRWPALTFELAKTSTSRLAQRWLEALPLCRVDALGISTGSDPDRRLLLRGWSESWNSKLLTVTATVTPYDAYAITTLGDTTNDPDLYPYVGWLDVDTVTTAADLAPGDTSIVVNVTGATLTHPASPDYADDIDGLYINIGGIKVSVTAISAPSGSQQTISIVGADVLRTLPAGTSVSAWNPARPGL